MSKTIEILNEEQKLLIEQQLNDFLYICLQKLGLKGDDDLKNVISLEYEYYKLLEQLESYLSLVKKLIERDKK